MSNSQSQQDNFKYLIMLVNTPKMMLCFSIRKQLSSQARTLYSLVRGWRKISHSWRGDVWCSFSGGQCGVMLRYVHLPLALVPLLIKHQIRFSENQGRQNLNSSHTYILCSSPWGELKKETDLSNLTFISYWHIKSEKFVKFKWAYVKFILTAKVLIAVHMQSVLSVQNNLIWWLLSVGF